MTGGFSSKLVYQSVMMVMTGHLNPGWLVHIDVESLESWMTGWYWCWITGWLMFDTLISWMRFSLNNYRRAPVDVHLQILAVEHLQRCNPLQMIGFPKSMIKMLPLLGEITHYHGAFAGLEHHQLQEPCEAAQPSQGSLLEWSVRPDITKVNDAFATNIHSPY